MTTHNNNFDRNYAVPKSIQVNEPSFKAEPFNDEYNKIEAGNIFNKMNEFIKPFDYGNLDEFLNFKDDYNVSTNVTDEIVTGTEIEDYQCWASAVFDKDNTLDTCASDSSEPSETPFEFPTDFRCLPSDQDCLLDFNLDLIPENASESLLQLADDCLKLANQANQNDAITLQTKPETKIESEIDISSESLDLPPITCMFCSKEFRVLETYLKHLDEHNGVSPYRCKYCKFRTCYVESFRKHYKKVHNMEVEYEEIYAALEDKDAVNDETQHQEFTYKCLECEISNFSTEAEIAEHLNMEHFIEDEEYEHTMKVKLYSCPKCTRTFKSQKNFRTHFTLTHGKVKDLKMHSIESHICRNCAKIFPHKRNLASHQMFCSPNAYVKCQFCSSTFANLAKFERHICSKHGVLAIHECEVCGKTFHNSQSLSLHRKRHTERHFQCEHCPRNYVNKTELGIHMARVHTNEAQVVCLQCDKICRNQSALRYHKSKYHKTEANWFQCKFCQYQSPSSCNVRNHTYTHTGKPYKCEACGKEFTSRRFLRRHALNVHSIKIMEEQMAAMFRNKFGYTSRYDAFTAKNSLEIPEVTEANVESELEEYGLKLNDIVKDLFDENEDLFGNVNKVLYEF